MKRVLAAIAAFALSAPVLAATATLSQASPGVLVNLGEQFQPGRPGQVLGTGDRVMVPGGGAAILTFEDGCQSQLQPDTLVTIPETSPCQGGQLVTQQVTPNAPTRVGTRPHPGESWKIWSVVVPLVLILWGHDEDDDDTESP